MSRNGQTPKLKKARWTRDDTELTILALPAIIWFLIFSYLPMPGIILAFKNFRPIPGKNFFQALFQAKWSGLDNFDFLFRSPDAGLMIFNTLFYNIVGLILGIILPVTMAIILSQLRSKKLMKVSQTMMFLPHFEYINDERTVIQKITPAADSYGVPAYTQGSFFTMSAVDPQPANQWDGVRELNERAETSPLLGFMFQVENVENEIAALNAVWQKYESTLLTGAHHDDLSVEDLVAQVNAEFEAAGLQTVIEEVQRQIDEFLAGAEEQEVDVDTEDEVEEETVVEEETEAEETDVEETEAEETEAEETEAEETDVEETEETDVEDDAEVVEE